MSKSTSYDNGIFAVDADYVRPKLAAIHLILENGRAALVDTGCNDSVPNVLAALDELGIPRQNVDYVMLTHIHLDHAGGAGLMMQQFPNAHLVVHPRGARHMADPSRLIEGTVGVYGAEATFKLYGEVLPIDPGRIIEATHELRVDLAGRPLLCLDTPGHAKHHIGIVDRKTGHIFTGDIFGVSYRELDTDGRQFVFPTTTPVQFDPQAMHASIDLLMSYQPQAMYLTHYSRLLDVPRQASHLHRLVDAFANIALKASDSGPERHEQIRQGLAQLLLEETASFGCRLPAAEILSIYENDLTLNAQGLGVWLDSAN
jgi:glyoxylase-like metal-dependent hydrolase (beta-lactamase superfamily II)